MSYAVHPARRVASKNGDFRYQGPKYSVALLSSISLRSLTIDALLARRARARPGTTLNDDSTCAGRQPVPVVVAPGARDAGREAPERLPSAVRGATCRAQDTGIVFSGSTNG